MQPHPHGSEACTQLHSHCVGLTLTAWMHAHPITRTGCTLTHRTPSLTAAAGPHKCSPGRPLIGSPCCEWPSYAPVWVSSRGYPGEHGGHCGLLTRAAPSKAQEGPVGSRHRPSHIRPGNTPAPGQSPPLSHDLQALPGVLSTARPWPGCCVPRYCPLAPLLAAAARRPEHGHSVRADCG